MNARLSAKLVTAFLVLVAINVVAKDDDRAALDIFQRRIVPIMQATNPSSCTECHLSGVDLKQYIRPTQEETYASLREAGLIDVQDPAKSKLLEFIGRTPEKVNPINERVRREEFAAFEAWINAAVKDPALAKAVADSARPGPQIPPEVVRHARKDRVLQSFLDNVWSEVGRCAACHSPDRNQQQVEEHGEQVSWIKLNDPEATLAYMLEADLIDLKNPKESLLLAKPTMQVEHGGGLKIMVGDRTYKQFYRFIEDYRRTAAGEYKSADELPAEPTELSLVSEIWLKVTEVPESFDGKLLRTDVYRWDDERRDWSPERAATGDRAIFGKGKLWQQHLTLLAPIDAPDRSENVRAGRLPAGRYRVIIYVDQENELAKNLDYELGSKEKIGEVEVRSEWPAGYDQMTVVRFPN